MNELGSNDGICSADDMNVYEHLVEWDQIFCGSVAGNCRTITRLLLEKRLPVSDVEFTFGDKRLVVAAKIQKGLSIPIRCTIREILAEGTTLRLVIENVSTFGSLPLPKNLLRLADDLKLKAYLSMLKR